LTCESYADVRARASKESKEPSLIFAQKQLNLVSSYESRAKEVESSKVESLQMTVISTICHTLYTVMNPATRKFIANVLRVSENEINIVL